MTKPAISIEGLGKEYVLGGAESYQENFREMMTSALTAPIRRFRRLGGQDSQQECIWALKDISFEVQPGEIVGIIGRNGAGKSTLLKILSRITEPTEGRVTTRGRLASLLEVGTGFHPELTGRENIYLNGAILGMSRREIRQKFDEIVDFAEVEKFLDTPVKRYSSGMYVRLAFAVAAHLEPEILVVDEVLAVGDVVFQKKCLGKMHDVTSEGRTVLFVSHNMAQIRRLTSRTAWLDGGKLIQDGITEDIIAAYLKCGSDLGNLSSRSAGLSSSSGFETLQNFSVKSLNDESVPRTGDGIKISMQAFLEKEILNPAFIVSIRTLEGGELLRISTNPVSGYSTGRLIGTIDCSLEIDKLPLTGGNYVLWAGLSIPNYEYLIPLSEVGRFSVEPADYYGSGFLMTTAFGSFVVDHQWTVEKIKIA